MDQVSVGMVPLLDPCQCGMHRRDGVASLELEPEPAATTAASTATAATAGAAAAATTVAATSAAAVLPRQWPAGCPKDSWNDLDFAPADLLAVARMAGLDKADATVSEGEGSWCSAKRSEQTESRSMTDVDDVPACLSHAAVFCDNVIVGELHSPSVQANKRKMHMWRLQLDDVSKDLARAQSNLETERAYCDRTHRHERAIPEEVPAQLEEREWHSPERASWMIKL